MASADVSQDAVFIGANRQAFAADYLAKMGLVAFGASTTVALWNPLAESSMGVYCTLKKHTKEVTGVRFVPGTPFLVSVGEDGRVLVWEEAPNGTYTLKQELASHDASVTCLAVVNEGVFSTGCSNGKVEIWAFNAAAEYFGLAHAFTVKPGFYPTTLALQNIDQNGSFVLAVGGTSPHLYIYGFDITPGCEKAAQFAQIAVLKGHEDWIKCLSFTTEAENSAYILASGSQDRYIRLWRLSLNEAEDNSDDSLQLVLLSNKKHPFSYLGGRGAFSFDALIMGHDDWVTGLCWLPLEKSGKPQLLSSSADTALMVWEMDESGIWCCVSRLGEMSIKGASTATGSSGGFWLCLWFQEAGCQYVLANGKTGSIRVYKATETASRVWEATLGGSGPIREATDVVWARGGEYFMATSLDQTTRLFAPWLQNRPFKTWHELARPQIHGYDMICADNIGPTTFVSAGDEKVLRVFEVTNAISKVLEDLSGIKIEHRETLPESAALPVLGLSNKAANEQKEDDPQQQQVEDYSEAIAETDSVLAHLKAPPLEDYLQRYTLFPEVEKLYGHGYEITCCATSPSGTLIASACRSNSAKHAVVRVFNVTRDFQQAQNVLEGHNLTITSLEFSPDGRYLLAVSRDRQLSLWRVVDEAAAQFELVTLDPKAHSRIIWDCSWAPESQHGGFFVTGSRDKLIKLWLVEESVSAVDSAKLASPVTSVSAALVEDHLLVIAVGTEDGTIAFYGADLAGNKQLLLLHTVDASLTPAGRISKVSFSKKHQGANLLLAVASSDTSVRVYTVNRSVWGGK